MSLSARVWGHRHRLAREASNAQDRWVEREALILELSDDAGFRGQGEAAPLPGYSPDSLAEAERSLAGLRIAEVPGESSLITEQLRDAQLTPSARCAAETALIDLASRCLGISAPAFLGATASATVAVCALIEDGSLQAQLAQAHQARERGIGTLKIKIGRPGRFAAECALLSQLRQSGGAALKLRADANGSFAADDLTEVFDALGPFDLEFIEEPIADGRWDLVRSMPIPLAADESLSRDDSRVLALDAFDRGVLCAAVLKPTTLGGPLSCLALGNTLTARGAQLVVGHAYEGPIAFAATAALALALASRTPMRFASGLDWHAGLSAWPGCSPPFGSGAPLAAWREPGLGVTVEGS
jgi:L-Ala-D/L-Glu epimerase